MRGFMGAPEASKKVAGQWWAGVGVGLVLAFFLVQPWHGGGARLIAIGSSRDPARAAPSPMVKICAASLAQARAGWKGAAELVADFAGEPWRVGSAVACPGRDELGVAVVYVVASSCGEVIAPACLTVERAFRDGEALAAR